MVFFIKIRRGAALCLALTAALAPEAGALSADKKASAEEASALSASFENKTEPFPPYHFKQKKRRKSGDIFIKSAGGGDDDRRRNNERIKKERKRFPFIYNREVQMWIQVFSSDKGIMSLWPARSARYFPLMQRILKSRGLPPELACVTLVESGLSASAVSPAHAVGYWQFIEPTARRFQLTVNDWLDERRDFEKSARAAARYLEVLDMEFDDWPLSLAAYNMGEARLRRLIQKYKTRDFWRLSRKRDFPRETAQYVPKVFAASHISKSPENWGLTQFSVLKPYQYDLFYAPGGTDLKTLAKQTGSALAELKALNPELKTGRIPKNIPNHRVRLPKGTAPLFSAYLEKKQSGRSLPLRAVENSALFEREKEKASGARRNE